MSLGRNPLLFPTFNLTIAMPALLSQPQTVIDMLEHNRATFPARPAVRLARPNCSPGNLEWDDVSYAQLFDDTQAVARHWSNELASNSVSLKPGDAITVWLPGTDYNDLLHLLAFLTLGMAVQMISHHPMPEQVLHLVNETSSKLLVASTSFLSREREALLPVPVFRPVSVTDVPRSTVPMPHVPRQGSDVGYILHTSGTTSGQPKAIPLTHDWLLFATKNFTVEDSDDGEIVRYWQGNMAHIGTIIMIKGCMRFGGCLVQSHTYPMRAEELYPIATKAKLLRILTSGNVATKWIEAARIGDERVFEALKTIKHIYYAGVGINAIDRDYATQHGMHVTALWASTEAGPLLTSSLDQSPTAHLLRPIHPDLVIFQPRLPLSSPQMYELIVPRSSPNAPPALNLCDAEGNLHSKDIFEEVAEGLYEFRGRTDDFFKLSCALEIKAAGLEADVKSASPDLVADCAVIGPGKDYVGVVIEPKDASIVGNLKAETELRRQVLDKQLVLNAQRYAHETIRELRQIAVVPPASLPRSAAKNMVRRDMVEKMMPQVVEALYRVPASA